MENKEREFFLQYKKETIEGLINMLEELNSDTSPSWIDTALAYDRCHEQLKKIFEVYNQERSYMNIKKAIENQ